MEASLPQSAPSGMDEGDDGRNALSDHAEALQAQLVVEDKQDGPSAETTTASTSEAIQPSDTVPDTPASQAPSTPQKSATATPQKTDAANGSADTRTTTRSGRRVTRPNKALLEATPPPPPPPSSSKRSRTATNTTTVSPTVTAAVKRRRRAEAARWETAFVLSDARSPLTKFDLRSLLLRPETWDALSRDEQADVLALFPSMDHVVAAERSGGTDDAAAPRPDCAALINDNNFRHDCARYQSDLADGFFERAWLEEAFAAHEMRRNGMFSEYEDGEFESAWGVSVPGGGQEEAEVAEEVEEAATEKVEEPETTTDLPACPPETTTDSACPASVGNGTLENDTVKAEAPPTTEQAPTDARSEQKDSSTGNETVAVTTDSVDTDEPVATDCPVATECPVSTDDSVATDGPATTTDGPVNTDDAATTTKGSAATTDGPTATTDGLAATDAPAVTDAPATDGPATDGPATDAPATDDPATDDPAMDDPAMDDPADTFSLRLGSPILDEEEASAAPVTAPVEANPRPARRTTVRTRKPPAKRKATAPATQSRSKRRTPNVEVEDDNADRRTDPAANGTDEG